MLVIGFVELKDKWKKGGKMAYWLYQKSDQDSSGSDLDQFMRKNVARQGNRNNFSILL